MAIGYWLSAAPAPDPFLRFRESTLAYYGPSADLTNLTEIRIGWFGPTNLDDPLTGDLWWAANLAVREANETNALKSKSETRNPKPEGNPKPELRNRGRSPLEPPVQPPATAPVPAGSHGQDGIQDSGLGLHSDFGFRISDFHRLPFRLIPRWSSDPWGTGVSQLTRMVYEEQPLAIIGSIDSASTHLAEQVAAKANLPLVSPIATDKSVTLAGVSWMFSCAPSDAAIARMLVDDILATLTAIGAGQSAIRIPQSAITETTEASALATSSSFRVPRSAFPGRLALLTCTDHESRMTAREVMREFSRRGRMPDFRFDVPPGATDLSRQMEALAASRAEVVLIVAGVEDSVHLVRAVRAAPPPSLGVRQPPAAFDPVAAEETTPEDRRTPRQSRAGSDLLPSSVILFGTHLLGRSSFRELADLAASGIRFPHLLTTDPSDARWAVFAERFQTERGRAPDYAAALTYDATQMLIEAIRRAGANRACIRDALAGLSPWPGLAGPIQFDGTGQNTRTNLSMATLSRRKTVPTPRSPPPDSSAKRLSRL